jgi:hypothetical protein
MGPGHAAIVLQAFLLIVTNVPGLSSSSSMMLGGGGAVLQKQQGVFKQQGQQRTSKTSGSNILPTSLILPKRLLTIFGLESSGTTFVTRLVAASIRIRPRDVGSGRNDLSVQEPNRNYEVQHVSPPSGNFCEGGTVPVVPAMYPALCINMNWTETASSFGASPLYRDCQNVASLKERYVYPKRYFVNISSHIQWYRDRGVEASAILVVRDATIGSMARSLAHCLKAEYREEEEQVGLQLMYEALQQLSSSNDEDNAFLSPPLVVLSYETLMNLGIPYFEHILERLQLPRVRNDDDGLGKTLHNGNLPYIRSYQDVKVNKFLSTLNDTARETFLADMKKKQQQHDDKQ